MKQRTPKAFAVIVAIHALALTQPASAAELAPLAPEEVTLENGDAAIRCSMLSQFAKQARFFDEVPNGNLLVGRINDRMIEIARNAHPDATQRELLTRITAVFDAYEELAVDGDTLKKGQMMKDDFQICLNRTGDLFGPDLLPDG